MNTPMTSGQDKRTLGYLLLLAVVVGLLLHVTRTPVLVAVRIPASIAVVVLLIHVTAWLPFKLFKVWQKRRKRKQEEGSA